MTPKRSMNRAFTLIELLVVIAIIGVLIALLVPAIQKVRAAAANTQCVNNLKQIGLAVHNYHDLNKWFPPGAWWNNSGLSDAGGWMFDLLPFIEQGAVYKLPDFATNIIPTYLCPADPRENAGFVAPATVSSVQHLGVPEGGSIKWARTSYLGVLGKSFPVQTTGVNWGNGVFGGWGDITPVKINIGDVTDGTSTTIMVGERPPAPNDEVGGWAWGAWAGWIGDNLLWAIADSSFAATSQPENRGAPCPDTAYFSQGDLINYCHTNHFWSFHNGGGNWLFCDGSVRFMEYSAGTSVIPAMASINGGEVIPVFD